MTDALMAAVRKVKEEADNLSLACVASTKGKALLHIAYDREVDETIPFQEAVLLNALGGLQ